MEKTVKNSIPKITVVIPTYKRPHLIGRAVQSVLNQTYQNFEIVIIDDSPNDDTGKIVREFNDKRIKYIRNKVRRGYSGARNQGVKESNKDSKYIAFLDDDDEYFPLFLEKTVKKIYRVMKCTEQMIHREYPKIKPTLPKNIMHPFLSILRSLLPIPAIDIPYNYLSVNVMSGIIISSMLKPPC